MSFQHASWLWLLLIPVALVALYLVMQQRRPKYTARFTNLDLLESVIPKRAGWKRHVPTALIIAGVMALVVSLAKPSRPGTVEVQQATLMVALDVSISMQATDVDPDRLTAMKLAAKRFIESAPPKVRIGIIAFAGSAQVLVTPTFDRQSALRAVNRLKLREGTAIGEAIFTALDALETDREQESNNLESTDGTTAPTLPPRADGQPAPERIVVMSDGETTMGRPDSEATDAAKAAGVAVTTVAFGTPDGVITYKGETGTVPVNPDKLRKIADDTGGDFFEAASSDELAKVFESITTRVRSTEADVDISPWFVGGGLALVVAGALASTWWFQRAL
jgi:Ca-activated chloride channel homolog